jgi:hypothetical protein
MDTVKLKRLTDRQYSDAMHALHHADADDECQTDSDAKTDIGRSLTRGCRILRQLLRQVKPLEGRVE